MAKLNDNKRGNQALSVKEVLEEAFGSNLVEDNYFYINARKDNNESNQIEKINDNSDDKIKYLEGTYTLWPNKSDFKRVIVSKDSNNNTPGHLAKFIDLINYTKKGEKAFLFYRFEKLPNFIFSVELVDWEYKTASANEDLSQTDILTESDIAAIKNSKENIIRIARRGGRAINAPIKVFTVAIKIGTPKNRDYTSLRNYIISSDNRTYNKVVRSAIEYVSIGGISETPKNTTELPHNLLVSGAPGTGKSHYLKESVLNAGKELINKTTENLNAIDPEDKNVTNTAKEVYEKHYVSRVTFYEDYSYENFVGCYKPVPEQSMVDIVYDNKLGTIKDNKIVYKFVSGPFIDTYIKAMKDKEHSYFLIIEEINRAKAASVFGDMFQLLDRNNGVSDYDIKPDKALDEYLKSELNDYNGFMKLPVNMYIWATMNSADQGVMPLDAAFKRRWAQMYMDITPDSSNANGAKLYLCDKDGTIKWVLWENLRNRINEVILNNGFDEDRCIGSWYFKDEEFCQIEEYFRETDHEKRKTMVNPLIDKLFYYLRQDVFRRNPGLMFKAETEEKAGITMSDIRRRVRDNESIDSILNINALQQEKEEEKTDNESRTSDAVDLDDKNNSQGNSEAEKSGEYVSQEQEDNASKENDKNNILKTDAVELKNEVSI